MNDRLHVLTLEAPESLWDESKELFDPIVEKLQF
jgi:hypothetical protein